jgi:molybdopterin molybdotransferase/putative molybdopterin biosynthesis protein
MEQQQQFLDVIDRDEAQSRFEAAISTLPLGEELISLSGALGRVLSRNVVAKVNVPSFDRANLDGYALRAIDTRGAEEHQMLPLQLLDEKLGAGDVPQSAVEPGKAVQIATGAMLPRGADAIVMVEHTDILDGKLLIAKSVSSGNGIAFAGTDVSSGEIILHRSDCLSSRETGILAAIGAHEVWVWKRPRVAVISTGNEIIAPGQPMQPGLVYDSNARIIADAVKELGSESLELGIAIDDMSQLRQKIDEALLSADMILLSGGTSKGQGDLSYRVVQEFTDPGVIVHGVALKPGKPICLAATCGIPVVVLPGFPTSAIFTFYEFVAPVIRKLSGLAPESRSVITAELAVRVNSEVGRKEFLLVGLVENQLQALEHDQPHLAAYPIGKGSGSVTTFSQADGFVSIERNEELVEAGTTVQVQLISRDLQLADLVIMGSHCVGLDLIMSLLKEQGIHTKFFAVGSTAGLAAVKRGQCNIAGMHLFDPASETYNLPFISPELQLIRGYRRKQGLIFRKGDQRFQSGNAAEIITQVKNDPTCLMINRNQGSGTRILIDQLLAGIKPNGYLVQTSNHRAVIAAIQQRRADWGIAVQSVVTDDDVAFLPLLDECYDFVMTAAGMQNRSVQLFIELLKDRQIQSQLHDLQIEASQDMGFPVKKVL